MTFIYYPKCSTCKNAKKFLDMRKLKYKEIDIKLNNPNAKEIKRLHEKSELDIKKFINTSGLVYRSLGLKDKIPSVSLEEIYDLLATDGMLLKRPILELEEKVLVGFKEKEWEENLDFFC